jgi:hypothetical protein
MDAGEPLRRQLRRLCQELLELRQQSDLNNQIIAELRIQMDMRRAARELRCLDWMVNSQKSARNSSDRQFPDGISSQSGCCRHDSFNRRLISARMALMAWYDNMTS